MLKASYRIPRHFISYSNTYTNIQHNQWQHVDKPTKFEIPKYLNCSCWFQIQVAFKLLSETTWKYHFYSRLSINFSIEILFDINNRSAINILSKDINHIIARVDVTKICYSQSQITREHIYTCSCPINVEWGVSQAIMIFNIKKRGIKVMGDFVNHMYTNKINKTFLLIFFLSLKTFKKTKSKFRNLKKKLFLIHRCAA